MSTKQVLPPIQTLAAEAEWVCFCGHSEPDLNTFLGHLCEAHRLLYPFPRDCSRFRQFLETMQPHAAELLSDGVNTSKDEFAVCALTEALACAPTERETLSRNFNRQCLFCQDVFSRLEQYFDHMYQAHGFTCGDPDGLVSILQFLESVQKRQEALQCLRCDKTFSDAQTLRTHMRKKKHFHIHQSNTGFDRFWLSNYAKPDEPWANQPWDIEPAGAESDESEEDENWDEWNNDISGSPAWNLDGEAEEACCLLCTDSVKADDVLQHMASEHGFDLSGCWQHMDNDCYNCIKVVNFVRSCMAENKCLR